VSISLLLYRISVLVIYSISKIFLAKNPQQKFVVMIILVQLFRHFAFVAIGSLFAI